MEAERDEDVWRDVVEGRAHRFGLIWDRHRDRVFRHLVRAGAPLPDAEDLTAAVFLELWRRRGSVRFVDGSLLPWLIVTAQNVCRNSARARSRYRAFLAKLPPPLPVADPAEEVAERHGPAAAQVRVVMASVSGTDRRLLALTVLEQFTVREACLAVGLSESAAKMRLSRLRTRLRAALVAAPAAEEVL